MKGAAKKDLRSPEISINRKGLRDFHVLERLEAGIELRGTEVKSIRQGHANLQGAFARVERDQVWLYDLEIKPYEKASHVQHEAKTRRRLLVHRREIQRLFELTHIKGNSLFALRLYWKGHRVKVELGVGPGKNKADQRATLKERAVKREVDREVSRFNNRNRPH
jgi:SsrA-binding protein